MSIGPFIGDPDWPATPETMSKNRRRKLDRWLGHEMKKMARNAARTLDNILLSALLPLRTKEP